MRSSTSSTSSLHGSVTDDVADEALGDVTITDGVAGACDVTKIKRRLRGGQERQTMKKGVGLQDSILKAIKDPLPPSNSPVRVRIGSAAIARPPSIVITGDDGVERREEEEEEEDGKENAGRRQHGRSTSINDADDDEVFEILKAGGGGGQSRPATRPGSRLEPEGPEAKKKKDPDEVDVTMSTPLTPSFTEASAHFAQGIERTVTREMRHANSYLDITSTSTSSTFNRSHRPKSLALECLPEEWQTWLRACTDGDIETAKRVLGKDPSLLNWSPPFTGRLAAIHVAVRAAHVKLVVWLIREGADVNQTTLSGYTALHIAAQQSNRGLVSELRSMGADVSKRDQFGNRYVHYASWVAEERMQLGGKESFKSCTSSGSRRIRSRPPSLYSRDSMMSGTSDFGRNSSIRDTVRGFFRNTFKKAHSMEKLHM